MRLRATTCPAAPSHTRSGATPMRYPKIPAPGAPPRKTGAAPGFRRQGNPAGIRTAWLARRGRIHAWARGRPALVGWCVPSHAIWPGTAPPRPEVSPAHNRNHSASARRCRGYRRLVVFPRSGTIRLLPGGNPGARTSPHGLSATTGTGSAGKGGSGSAATLPPALTKAQAEQVLSTYSRVNNEANEQRSDSLLGTIEAGTSYSMDIGAYRFEQVSDPSNSSYVAFAPVHAVYYIPRQPADVYPRWFVVAVTYASLASPQDPTGSGYLLFSQASLATPGKMCSNRTCCRAAGRRRASRPTLRVSPLR